MKSVLEIYFHVKNKLENAPGLRQVIYHGWMHTKSFYDTVCYLAALEGVDDHDTIMIKIAAIYHDTGYLNGLPCGHEFKSAVMAHKDLELFGFSDDDISQVCRLIMSTSLSNRPVGILEEIMRDADFEHLGRDYYPYVSELLRVEKNAEHAVWKVEQVSFMKKHQFLTSSARLLFDNQKAINLKTLEEQIIKEQVK